MLPAGSIGSILGSGIVGSISSKFSGILDDIQAVGLFQLNALKEQKLDAIKQLPRKVWVGPILRNAVASGYECHYLEPDCWKLSTKNIAEVSARLRDSIVIVQNNDLSGVSSADLQEFGKLYEMSPTTIFAVWDTDNHHWLELSLPLCLIADYYFPAHLENLSVLSKFNQNVKGPVFTGSMQWSKEFLLENLDLIKNADRQGLIFGRHGFYPKFGLRNQMVKTMSSGFPDVTFTDGVYRNRTAAENLREWCSYKLHFVALVNNDLPYRLFDALITGGIVFLPSSLEIWKEFLPCPESIFFYHYSDVLSFQRMAERGVARFDELHSRADLHERSVAGIGRLHVDDGVSRMLRSIEADRWGR